MALKKWNSLLEKFYQKFGHLLRKIVCNSVIYSNRIIKLIIICKYNLQLVNLNSEIEFFAILCFLLFKYSKQRRTIIIEIQ